MTNSELQRLQSKGTGRTQTTTRKPSAGAVKATTSGNSTSGSNKTGGGSASSGKKPKRRATKKQIRRTVAGLFMATAITVAAIPTPKVEATFGTDDIAGEYESVKVSVFSGYTASNIIKTNSTGTTTNYDTDCAYEKNYQEALSKYPSNVPIASSRTTANDKVVYTSEDNKLQFVYLDPNEDGGRSKVAMIVGYRDNGESSLTIPKTLQAYRRYTDTNSGSVVNCLVTINNELLFYADRGQKIVDQKKYYIVPIETDFRYNGVDYKVGESSELEINDVDDAAYLREEDGKLYFIARQPVTPTPNPTYAPVPTPTEAPGGGEGTEPTASPAPTPDPTYAPTYNERLIEVKIKYSDDLTYHPCTYENKDHWDKGGTTDTRDANLYYFDESANKYFEVGGDDKHWRIEAAVQYIGQEYTTTNASGETIISGVVVNPYDSAGEVGNVCKGVFAKSSFSSLNIDAQLQGIGDFAFYDNTSLSSINYLNESGTYSQGFPSSLFTIGNGAFANCTGLVNCDLTGTRVRAIGKDAFIGCAKLSSFTTNNSLNALGDSCFENCYNLTTFTFVGDDNLKEIGYHAFRNCNNLTSLSFPSGYTETIELDTFYGCSNLQWLKVNNSTMDLKVFHKDKHLRPSSTTEDGVFPLCLDAHDWDDILDTFPDSFYIWGPDKSDSDNSAIHQTCGENSIVFRYDKEPETYEIKVFERDINDDVDEKTAPVLYQIDTYGSIIKVNIENGKHPLNLTIPSQIGQYGISKIDDEAFVNNCYVTKVTIPGTVTSIGNRAFAGCHNLQTVHFINAENIQSIGNNAFKTQDVNRSSDTSLVCLSCGEKLDQTPSLIFCGSMQDSNLLDTEPFKYAMNENGNINIPAQNESYIEYHSLYPESLVAQYMFEYNDDATKTGRPVLIDYPRYSDYGKNKDDELTAIAYVKTLPDVYFAADASGNVPRYELDDYGNPKKDSQGNNIKFKDNEDFYDKVDAVTNAYYNFIHRGEAGIDFTDVQNKLILAAKNIKIPASIEAIDKTGIKQTAKDVGIFSGVKYDKDGLPVYFADEPISGASSALDGAGNTGYLIYTDKDNNLFVDEEKNTPVSDADLYKVKRNPYVPDSSVTNTDLQSIDIRGVSSLDPFVFFGNTTLSSADLSGPEEIGNYAFDGCANLSSVTFGSNLSDTGIRPFRGCKNLFLVNTASSPYTCEKGLLIRREGENVELVECLESRGRGDFGDYSYVSNSELADITSLKEEAFMGCSDIDRIDFSESSLTSIPFRCFRDSGANTVYLGNRVKNIGKEAFLDMHKLTSVRLPYSISTARDIAQDAFADTRSVAVDSFDDSGHNPPRITVSCAEDSGALDYANKYVYLKPTTGEVSQTFEVNFYDDTDFGGTKLTKTQVVNAGSSAVAPEPPIHDGYVFKKWVGNYTSVYGNTNVYASYSPESAPEYDVEFYDIYEDVVDAEGNVTVKSNPVLISTQTVSKGNAVTIPSPNPSHEGYTFTGWTWTPSDPTSGGVLAPTKAFASYKNGLLNPHTITYISSIDNKVIGVSEVSDGSKTVAPAPPTYSGYTFEKWVINPADFDFNNVTTDATAVAVYKSNTSGGGGGGGGGETGLATPTPTGSGGSGSSATATPSPGSNNGDNTKKYTVTVSGGSGTGSYAAGAIVAINAYDMGAGQTFDKWTTSTAGVGFASATSPSTYFVMPANNVAVTATYKAGGSGSAATSGSGGSGSSGTRSGTANPAGQTTVDISKSGISNRNVAGATVSGSTDNFIVKITDDQHASDMALQALQNAYGDITRVKYLPMDISLYDSTGRTKITDTAGLAVGITMPLPDELAQYAGNNKIASTESGTLDNLNSRFTTVDGVPCISFTATHFSPYVIYVDTANLTETTIDYTPKTGDPIHPKWFLSIGLAAAAVVLFFMKDKKAKVTPA